MVTEANTYATAESLSPDSYESTEAENPIAVFIFAHGAGADKNHAFMTEVTEQLVAQNISVVRFNFPFMIKRALDGKRRPPDRMPALLVHYQAVIQQILAEQMSESTVKLPIYIGGKSMGSRVAISLLNQQSLAAMPCSARIKGGIAIGYPFHPQKQSEKLRLAPLQESALPVLICQGERDALGSQTEIAEYQLTDLCQLRFFVDGDHDLKPRVKSGFNHQQHKSAAVQEIVSFINEHN
ncbi:MAG: alpha/beta family hydrolase [Thalassotalea sp.]